MLETILQSRVKLSRVAQTKQVSRSFATTTVKTSACPNCNKDQFLYNYESLMKLDDQTKNKYHVNLNYV